MDTQQQRTLSDELGGEPLEGSGFENEQSIAEHEVAVGDIEGQQKGEEI